MRTKIEAGQILDAASPDEVRAILANTVSTPLTELTLGPTYVTVTCSGAKLPPGTGAPLLVGMEPVGPHRGRTWAIRRIGVFGPPVDLHLNEDAPSTYIGTVGGNPGGWTTFPDNSLIIRSGSILYLHNSNTIPLTVSINLGIADVPSQAEARL